MIMSIDYEIRRIKHLMYENYELSEFVVTGDVNDPYGVKILLKTNRKDVGFIHFVNFDHARYFDEYLDKMYQNYEKNCKSKLNKELFNGANSAYMFDLEVDPEQRGRGLGRNLLRKCEDLIREKKIPYCLLITSVDNKIARNLYDSENYKIHLTDGKKIVYFKKI